MVTESVIDSKKNGGDSPISGQRLLLSNATNEKSGVISGDSSQQTKSSVGMGQPADLAEIRQMYHFDSRDSEHKVFSGEHFTKHKKAPGCMGTGAHVLPHESRYCPRCGARLLRDVFEGPYCLMCGSVNDGNNN